MDSNPPSTGSTSRVTVKREGRVVGEADIAAPTEDGVTATVALRPDHGAPAAGSHAELVDTVMQHPDVRSSESVHVVLPIGDTEAISQLQHHTENFDAHAAGASSIVDADVKSHQ